MTHCLSVSFLRQLYILWVVPLLVQRCHAVSRSIEDSQVLATNTTIEYNPPLDDSNSDWETFIADGYTGVVTKSLNATAAFTFQGSSFNLFVNPGKFLANVEIMLDDQSSSVSPPSSADNEALAFSKAGLDPTVNHTVVIQKSSDTLQRNGERTWNILYLSFTPPSSAVNSLSLGVSTPVASLVDSGPPSASATSSQESSHGSAAGTIAGAVIGALFGVAAILLLSFCLHRRRRRQTLALAPCPLVITPATPTRPPRRSRSQFRRIYSHYLPHFVAPSSVWPPSTPTALSVSPLPAVRDSLHEVITPFWLPAPAPKAHGPPPKRKARRHAHTPFFVTNPSSRSGHSDSSRSHSDGHAHVRAEPTPVARAATALSPVHVDFPSAEGVLRDERRRREKGKQRAVEIEIEPVQVPVRRPLPPKMKRSQSFRRFFTTNPNPSTSSSSSTSSRRSKSTRRAAVAEYVRAQMRQKAQPGSASILPPAPALSTSPAVAQRPMANVHHSPAPKRTRQSQTVFFTTNPSTHTMTDVDEESVLSEPPRPRLDKGKGRAF